MLARRSSECAFSVYTCDATTFNTAATESQPNSACAGGAVFSVASIPIPGGRSLRPVKNGGDFDKVADQNFSYFQWANYTFNKTFPYFFYFSPIFQSAPLT